MKCPHCNGEHPNFFKFCPVTGKTISPNLQTADADSGLYHQDEGAAPHLASESGIITGGNSSSSNQEKAKNIESIGIDECCKRLGIRKKYIDFDLEAIELPSEEERQLIDRLRKLIDTDKKEYSDCETVEDYIKYLNHWTDGLWRDAASQNIERLREKLQKLAALLEETLDLEGLISMAREAPQLLYREPELPRAQAQLPGHGKILKRGKIRIGVAQDEAFCFTYRDNLQLLQDLGAELVPFSPLADAGLPENLQGLILSGGYPELHAARLAENASMREAVREAVQGGLPCIAECGGFLYLHRTLEGEDGKDYPMAGVLSARAYRTPRLSRFGYITLTAKEDQLLLAKGEEIRGHEFHYWESESCGEAMRAQKPLRMRGWDCVHGTASLYAGFPHLFFYSNPDAALRFLEKCEERLC